MKKILVIEDEPEYSKILQDQLISNGYKVVVANNGKNGLSMARKEKPDLILLDLRMPVMDGMTMLNLLRKDAIGKTIKVIILTIVNPDDKVIAQINQTKYTYYCVKSSISLDELIKKINEVIAIV